MKKKECSESGECEIEDVVSATEMTGLIPAMPGTNEEKENYEQLVHYKKRTNKKLSEKR